MFPVPPQRTQDTGPWWPERTKSIRWETVSQTLTVASLEEEARRGRSAGVQRWKGSHARLRIAFVWPFNGPPSDSPLCGFHNRTLLSIEPVAKVQSSGDHETARINDVWPFKVYFGVPVSQSHIRILLSPLPVARREAEAGEN